MTKDMVKLVCMIDRSISMKGQEKKVIQTYNSLIDAYKKSEEKCFVTTCLFAEKINMLCLQNEISSVGPLTERDYYIEGSTALYDAVKTTFSHVDECLEYLKDDIQKHINVYMITDGIDNGSVEMLREEFESLIQTKQELGWRIRLIEPEGGE